MCFRPTTVAKPKKCPKCNAINPAMAKNCIKCKEPLENAPPEKQG